MPVANSPWSLPVVALSAAVLVGCGGDYVRNASCDAPVAELTPDLTTHLMNGPGDGSFAYDPAGGLLASITGEYDTTTGDFSWTELGGPGSWINNAEASGYGYANRNGDLDVIGERTVVDSVGVELRQQFRIERVGCSIERRVRDFTASGEREQVEVGSYVGSTYTYQRDLETAAITVETEGQRTLGLDYSETSEGVADGYSYTAEITGNLSDYTSITESDELFDTRNGQVNRIATTERFTDGSRVISRTDTYPSGDVYQWDFELDQGGNGEGTLQIGNTTCELQYVANQCTYTCPGGQSGAC